MESKVADQIKTMEAQIAALKMEPTPRAPHDERECTAVLGGLSGLDDEDEAAAWLMDKLASLSAPTAKEVYTKGDEYRGTIFAKFGKKAERDDAVNKLRKARYQHGDKAVWAKPDLPFEERAMRHLLFGAKRVMTEWGYDKSALWADTSNGTLSIAGEKVVSAAIADRKLTVRYGPQWEEYLHSDAKFPEWKELVDTIRAKLDKAPSKGKGKARSRAE